MLAYPGRRSRIVTRIALSVVFVMLSFLGFTAALPTSVAQPGDLNSQTNAPGSPPSSAQQTTGPSRFTGADPVPDLSLPKAVSSSVDSLIGAGGVTQDSPQNLTLYNSAVTMRLLGTPAPHDMLLGPARRALSSDSSWSVEAYAGGSWISLAPTSNNFTLLGTNRTGTFVIRTMQVSNGTYSAIFKIVYKATSAGPLKWDLELDPATSGQYRFSYSWLNISRYQILSASQFRANFASANYTFSWGDIPTGYAPLTSVSGRQFSLFVNLGSLIPGSKIIVDPSIVSNSTSLQATAFTFQRKVFYEPRGGNYFVFYYDGSSDGYRYSRDGVNWSAKQSMPSGWPAFIDAPTSLPTVYNANQKVVVAVGDQKVISYSGLASVWIRYWVGTITGPTIVWGAVQTAGNETRSSGGQTLGIRYVSLSASSDGNYAFSYNFYATGSGGNLCGIMSPVSSETTVFLYYKGTPWILSCNSGGFGFDNEQDRSIIVPDDPVGGVRIVYQFHSGSQIHLFSEWYLSATSYGQIEIVEGGSVTDSDEFSAVADANYVTQILYRSGVNYNITNAFLNPESTSGGYFKDIFAGPYSWPTITVDYSTNNLYAFASDPNHGFAVMRVKPFPGAWWDSQVEYPATAPGGPAYLGSNAALASSSNSTNVMLIWTQTVAPGLYQVAFSSIPVGTVWSPYSDPPSPWDGNGVAPYGQYFTNMGEYVSPSTGMLTVQQTDLSVPGRGLNLEITRTYTEPYRFFGSAPYQFEAYPWASFGNGWQLNFPWMSGSSYPAYVHLWNGEGYSIPSFFWNGPTSTYDNHQGEQFHLVRYLDGTIALFTPSGTAYKFDSGHRLANITDTTGLNYITFSYANNLISKINDTVGRTFLFCYLGGFLHSINQTTGTSCTSSIGSVRGIVYTNTYPDLTSVTDPAGRFTSYVYDFTGWLITKITYPTKGFDTFSYSTFASGATNIYRVGSQQVNATRTSSARKFQYAYNQYPGDQVSNSTVATYDPSSTIPVSYTTYSFSFTGVTWNISDSGHKLIQGTQQLFDVHGDIRKEVHIVTDQSGLGWPPGSYTNYYQYDLWGNRIYTRNTIFQQPTQPYDKSAWYHETFNSGYNDGLQPGFNAFQDTFSENQGTAPDNSWSAQGGQWQVQSGIAFIDNNFTSGWTKTTVGVLSNLSEGTNGDILSVTASPGSTGDDYRAWVRQGLNVNTTLYPLLVARWMTSASSSSCTGLGIGIVVWYTDGSSQTPQPTDCTAFSSSWTTTSYALTPNKTLKEIDLFMNDNPNSLASGTYSVYYDYVAIANEIPSSQFDTLGEYSGTETSGLQEANFAWADIGKSDLSMQAKIFVTKQVNASDQRVGIFVHHSTANYKWMLVIHNRTGTGEGGTGTYLDITDEFYGGWASTGTSGVASCPLVYNVWWTFSMAVHGLNVTGTATYPGQGSPCSVSRTLSSSSPAIAGTGFGLYSGGYSALFDNVTATTVTPFITSTGFSNSFINNGAPNSNIHSAIAGTAQLQNGTGTSPIETYYSYYPWGELNQTKYGHGSQAALWLTSSRNYDQYGNLITLIDPMGNSTSYAYSSSYQNAYLTSQTQTLVPGSTQITSTYGYNFTTGTRTSTVDQRAYNTTFKYDILGRPTRVIYPTRDYANYTYNDAANYVDTTNENGWKTRQIYDPLGRLTTTERFLNGLPYSNQTSTYNWQDEIVTQTDQVGHVYTHQYDPLGRLTRTTEPDGNFTQILYNDVRGWIEHLDQNNLGPSSWTFYAYDRQGQLIDLTEPNYNGDNEGLYYYDEIGNLRENAFRSSACPFCQPTTYIYDDLNRLTKKAYPDNSTETYAYDNNGNLVLKTDRMGIQTSNGYDSLNRLTKTTYSTISTPNSYGYDANGNLLSLSSQNATVYRSYDSRNRVSSEIYQIQPLSGNFTVHYYYKGELLSQIIYPDNQLLNYTYDSMGRISNAFKPGSTSYAAINYYPTDQVKSVIYGNGLWSNYTYDTLNRPSAVTLTQGGRRGNTLLLSLAYGYNKTGNVALVNGQVNNVLVKEQYNYDPLMRLTNATLTNGSVQTSQSYQYDTYGNALWLNQNGAITNYIYNSANNELKSESGSSTVAISYNADGNLLTKNVTAPATAHWTYAWNGAGRLMKVSNDAGVQGTYGYDGMGRMVISKESTMIFYLYTGTETLYQVINGSLSPTDYVYASGLRIAKLVSGTPVYYHLDALGSTRLTTNPSGSVTFANNYQPFGQDNGNPTCTGTCETYRFTGKPVSQTTGLYYYFHRWYDPSIGRFISADPKQGKLSNPQSLNLYIYVLDDPATLKDPSGLDWWNPFTWSQQEQAQAFTIAVIAVSIVVVVATAGVGTPLAAAAIGAAIGASTSTAAYTFTQGSKATLGGALLSGVTGAVAGAIGGGAGGLALNFVKAGGSLAVGMLAAGAGQALGTQVGNFVGDRASGKTYNANVGEIFTDVSIGAVTFGVGAKLGIGKDAATMAENRMYGSLPTGQSTLDPFLPGSIVQSQITRWTTAITVGQVGYDVGTQAVGGLIDYFMQ